MDKNYLSVPVRLLHFKTLEFVEYTANYRFFELTLLAAFAFFIMGWRVGVWLSSLA